MSNARKMLMGGRKVTTFPTSYTTYYTTYYQQYHATGYTERRSRYYRGQYQEYDVFVETGGYYTNESAGASRTTTASTWKYTSW